jgi:hypothetical protein
VRLLYFSTTITLSKKTLNPFHHSLISSSSPLQPTLLRASDGLHRASYSRGPRHKNYSPRKFTTGHHFLSYSHIHAIRPPDAVDMGHINIWECKQKRNHFWRVPT